MVFLILNDIRANGCQSSTWGFSISGVSGYCNITNSEITGYNSVLQFFPALSTMLLHVENCSLHNNTGSRILGSAISIYAAEGQNQTYTVTNVSFSGNVYVPEPFSITFAPTLFIQSSTVNITNCQFIANQGSALYVDNSSVHLLGHNYFGYSTGYISRSSNVLGPGC